MEKLVYGSGKAAKAWGIFSPILWPPWENSIRRIIHYYMAIVIGCITGLARLFSLCPVLLALGNQKGVEKLVCTFLG